MPPTFSAEELAEIARNTQRIEDQRLQKETARQRSKKHRRSGSENKLIEPKPVGGKLMGMGLLLLTILFTYLLMIWS